MTFQERLKQLRKEHGMTQVQLAEKLGVASGTVAMWETGKRSPNFDMIWMNLGAAPWKPSSG